MVGPEVEAQAGFTQRTDVRKTDLFLRRGLRTSKIGLRRLDFLAGGNLFTGVDGTLQDWQFGPIVSAEFESGDNFIAVYQAGESRPDEEFDLADTLFVPAGAYDGDMAMVLFNSSSARPVVVDANLRRGDFYGGTIMSLGGNLSVAPSPQVALSVGLSRNRVEIPSGDFTAKILSLRGSYSFSTRLTTNLLVQYNSLDQEFSTNLRVNFIHRPGSDLFLVFTEERGYQDDLWEVSDRGAVVKLTYLKRF
jgi:hypothetical protein